MSGSLLPTSRRLLLDSTPQIVEPPMGSNGTMEESYTGKTDYFDTNMIIILVALLCALICALGINSIARCALRCGRTFRPETPQQAEARMATTGLKKRALKQIPVAVYGSKEEAFEVTECPICLGEFVDGEKVRVLPKCNHRFHVRCIDAWLVSHSSCPNCRHSLIDQPQHPPPPTVTSPGNRPGLNHVVVVMDN